MGVDVFFVLSGFLITRLILNSVESQSFTFFDFYIRRARRLLPALMVSILITLFFSAFILSPEHFEDAGQSGLYATLGVANIHYWLSAGYFDLSTVVKPFIHYWSLGVEEQFYLIWPALIVISAGFFTKGKSLYLVIFLSLASFAAMWIYQSRYYDAVFYLMLFRIWEFGLGAILAYGLIGQTSLIQRASNKASVALTFFGFLLIFSSFFKPVDVNQFSLTLLAPTLGAALIILGQENALSRFILGNTLAVSLGKISYSLYLYHWPVIIFTRYIFGADLSLLMMGICSLFSLFCAYISYKYVETPFRKQWASSKQFDRTTVPAVLAPIALLIVVVCSHIWVQSGWSWRLSPEQQQIVAARTQKTNPNCERRNFDGASEALCVFGDKRQYIDMAIIGDSHSNVLASGLTSLMQREKLTGVAKARGGAVPLMNTFIEPTVGRGYRGNVNGFFEDVFTTKPEFLILHARYAFYWHTIGGPNEIGTRPRYLMPLGDTQKSSIQATQHQFEKAMIETLIAVKAQGIKPIIVGPVPNPGVDPIQCLSKPFLRTVEKSMQHCHGFSQQESLDRNAEVSELLKRIAKDEGAIYIDPTPLYCKKEEPTCRLIMNGKVLYKDDDHLSLFGARILASRVIKAIQADRETMPE